MSSLEVDLADFCNRKRALAGCDTVGFDRLDEVIQLSDCLDRLNVLPKIRCWVVKQYFRGSPVFPDGNAIGCRTQEQASSIADILNRENIDNYEEQDRTTFVVEEGVVHLDRIVLDSFKPEHIPYMLLADFLD